MFKVIVVGKRTCNNAESLSSDVIMVPEVYYSEGRKLVNPKKRGIEHAMFNAVKVASPGDLIMQDDISMFIDPFMAPRVPGFVRTFAPKYGVGHYCPRAFMFYDATVKDLLLGAWDPERLNIPDDENACRAWADIPKMEDFLGARHGC